MKGKIYLFALLIIVGLGIGKAYAADQILFENYFDSPIVTNQMPAGFTSFVNHSLSQPLSAPKRCFEFSGKYGVVGKSSTDQSARIYTTDALDINYNNIYFENSFSSGQLDLPTDTKVTIEYEILPMDNNTYRYLQIQTNGTNWNNVAGVYFASNGIITDAKSSSVELSKYKTGKWIHVAVIFTYGSKSYDIFIDGIKVGTGSSTSAITSIKLMRFSHGPLATKISETFYDNIKIYKGEFDSVKFLNNIIISSKTLNINIENTTISNIPNNMTCEELKNAISIPSGSSINVFQQDKQTLATGNVLTGMVAVITSINGSTIKEYKIFKISATLVKPTNDFIVRLNREIILEVSNDPDVKQVEFFVNSISIGIISDLPFEKRISFNQLGTYNIEAFAITEGGDSISVGKSMVTCSENSLPNLSITPAGDFSITYGQTLNFTANATDNDGAIQKVSVYIDNILYDWQTIAPYSFAIKNIPMGDHTVMVVAADNEGGMSSTTGKLTCSVQKNMLVGEYNFNGSENLNVAPNGFKIVNNVPTVINDFVYGTINTDIQHEQSVFMGCNVKKTDELKGYIETTTLITNQLIGTAGIAYDFKYIGTATKVAFAQMRSVGGRFNDQLYLTAGNFSDGISNTPLSEDTWYTISLTLNPNKKTITYVITDSQGQKVYEQADIKYKNQDFDVLQLIRITLYGNDGASKFYVDNYKVFQKGDLSYPKATEFIDYSLNKTIKGDSVSVNTKEVIIYLSDVVDYRTVNGTNIKLFLGEGNIELESVAFDKDINAIVVKISNSLIPGTIYDLRITGGVKDVSGYLLQAGILISFKTEVASFGILESKFTVDGRKVSNISETYGKSVQFEATIKNDLQQSNEITLMVVTYKNETMVGCEFKKVVIQQWETTTVTLPSLAVINGSIIEGYILDSKTLRALSSIMFLK